MTTFEVKYAKVQNAFGKVLEGWIVFEDGRPGYPFDSKERAIRQAQAVAQLRIVNGVIPTVKVEG